MKTRTVFALAAALVLGAPAAAQAATVPVQQLNGDFAASNNSVTKTPDGVHFGVYADGARTGGTLVYNGVNRQTFGSLTALGYTYNYTTSADLEPRGAPYLRVLLDANGDGIADHDVIFDATICGTVSPTEDEDHAVDVTTQLVRVDDDDGADCANTQTTFAAARTALAGNTIVGIIITQGFTGGSDLSAQVRNLTVNGNTFVFNVPPVGPAGPAGPTTIQQVPVPAGALPATAVAGTQAARTCRGAALRRIHAPARKGEKFLRVNAALQSPTGLRALKANGRTVTVDLRNRPEANYNVRLISRYRTKSGKIRRVVTRRNLSVACS
jgi:hypothetical protein